MCSRHTHTVEAHDGYHIEPKNVSVRIYSNRFELFLFANKNYQPI